MSREVTEILHAWREGDPQAAERLMPLVYDELRSIAGRYLRGEKQGHAFQTTDLVHEAYLRLLGQQQVDWRERAHFYAIAAKTMRRVLLDHARGQLADKRGAGRVIPLRTTLDLGLRIEKAPELVALSDALDHLEQIDAEKATLVELRYFGGLTVAETAEAMGLSTATVTRLWRTARAFLYHHITEAS